MAVAAEKAKNRIEEHINGNGKKAAATPMTIPDLDLQRFTVWIVGDSELIQHKWAKKAIAMMLGKQTGEATAGKEPKNPQVDFLDSLYCIKPGNVVGDFESRTEDGHPAVMIEGGKFAFPSVAFKAAMVDACTSLKKAITKVQARQSFHILGELTEIFGQPRMRLDMVRLNGQTSDIRFRGGFPQWAASLAISYNTRVLSDQQLINLLNVAGFGVGVGEWRPEKNGPYGRFHVGTAAEVKAMGL